MALHFAGLYMIENYAVPASTIRKFLKDRPWHPESVATPALPSNGASAAPVAISKVETRLEHGQVTITIPVTVTVSLGAPSSTNEVKS